ncbi:MAG: phosphorylase [Coleofasciculus sp. G1-WW12-02]|uniref:ATP adenylyltransferase family protein n=1 Tax=Coleofasciculus sp. G1-WW12-02 TaxID=3068483 RepID=UPI0032F9F272
MPEEKPTEQKTLTLKPGTLWSKVQKTTEHALQCGALQPIATECKFVEQDGIRFLVRIASNLDRKDKDKKQQKKKKANSGKEFNPFLPYEEDLFVADISDTHLCLLNKFNVVDYHLLIVTREYEDQDNWLTLSDFQAMWAGLAEIDGLAFYNGGKIAGASQRHKHLQLVPLPLIPEISKLPIEPAIASANFQGSIGRIPSFPFVHAITRFDPNWIDSPDVAAKAILDAYHRLLDAVGMPHQGIKQSAPYNLLATREWMLLVPRKQEEFESISVNSLGFAGALLVRNSQQMQLLKDSGPVTILKQVSN